MKRTGNTCKIAPARLETKLAFSVAIFHEPKIVFWTNQQAEDPATRRQFWEMICRRPRTTFVTTHYGRSRIFDRVSIMVDGRIDALDSPKSKNQFKPTIWMEFQQLARRASRKADYMKHPCPSFERNLPYFQG